MLFSISCHRNANQDSIERLDKAQSYHNEAVNLYKNDSLEQSLSKFIDALNLIETLPEYMTEEEKKELYEAYKKCWDYDPSEEEVNSRYDEEFLKACDEIMNK
mgnify:CR=1 FL=1